MARNKKLGNMNPWERETVWERGVISANNEQFNVYD
jgi:hypothetical protein